MLNETVFKTERKEEDGDQLRNRSKTPNEVKPVKNKNKNSQSFLEKSPVQKEVPPSHRLQDQE